MTLGVATGRDKWVYNFSRKAVEENVETLINTYNHDVASFRPSSIAGPRLLEEAKSHATYDDKRIKWNRETLRDLSQRKPYSFRRAAIRQASYRPFTPQWLYFDGHLNAMQYRVASFFPSSDAHQNQAIVINSGGNDLPFCLLAVRSTPDLAFFGQGVQFFARFVWVPVQSAKPDLLSGLPQPQGDIVIDGYQRFDNIPDATLTRYQEAFGADVTKDSIFSHIYGLLHSEEYRGTFAAELKRQLPRVPLTSSSSDFWAFTEAGEKLLDLHTNYEDVKPHPLVEEASGDSASTPDYYRVQKLKWGGKSRDSDKSRLVYNTNITLAGIPDEAHEYMLGSRSALEWLIDRYQVKTDKASNIVNDPNDWVKDHGHPRYVLDLIKKIVTVSVETVKITKSLPSLEATVNPVGGNEGS